MKEIKGPVDQIVEKICSQFKDAAKHLKNVCTVEMFNDQLFNNNPVIDSVNCLFIYDYQEKDNDLLKKACRDLVVNTLKNNKSKNKISICKIDIRTTSDIKKLEFSSKFQLLRYPLNNPIRIDIDGSSRNVGIFYHCASCDYDKEKSISFVLELSIYFNIDCLQELRRLCKY